MPNFTLKAGVTLMSVGILLCSNDILLAETNAKKATEKTSERNTKQTVEHKTRQALSHKIDVQLTLPKLNVSPYHRPYVAIWLETPEREYITSLALWADDKEWYKDLRQWWRRAGRHSNDYDGITGATKRPGKYHISWDSATWFPTRSEGETMPTGNYLLNIEVVREEGGRDYIRQTVVLSQQPQSYRPADKKEVRDIRIEITSQGNTAP